MMVFLPLHDLGELLLSPGDAPQALPCNPKYCDLAKSELMGLKMRESPSVCWAVCNAGFGRTGLCGNLIPKKYVSRRRML